LACVGRRSVCTDSGGKYRLTAIINVPRQMAESEIVDFFRQRSRENGEGYTSFLGAGRLFPLSTGHH